MVSLISRSLPSTTDSTPVPSRPGTPSFHFRTSRSPSPSFSVSSIIRPKNLKRDSTHLDSSSLSSQPLDLHRGNGTNSPTKRLKVAFSDDVDIHTYVVVPQYINDLGSQGKSSELIREEVRVAIESHVRFSNVVGINGTTTVGNGDDSPYQTLRNTFSRASCQNQLKRAEDEHIDYAVKDINASRVRRGSALKSGGVRLKIQDDAEEDEVLSSVVLGEYVIALSGRIGELKGCGGLIHTILDVDWFGRTELFIRYYLKFLGGLISVHPGFTRPVMKKMIAQFVNLPSIYGRIPNEPIVRKKQMLANIHAAIRYLTHLLPSAGDALVDALKSQFPNHRMVDKKAYLSYIRNMFHITTYTPEIRPDVFTIVTERLVKIDVEIQKEIEISDEGVHSIIPEYNQKSDDYFQDDDDSDDSDNDSDMSSNDDETRDERQVKDLKEKTYKLDAGMDFLFKYHSLDPIHHGDDMDDSYTQLLSLFSTFVLPTYRSRNVQFLIFHFTQIDMHRCARFVTRCLSLIQANNNAITVAVFGAAYLGSFLARAARLQKTLVRDVVGYLLSRINHFMDTYNSTARGPDIGKYRAYYACVQALLYVFCFRWRELLFNSSVHSSLPDDEYDYSISGESLAIKGLKETLTQCIYSRLNPLKVCAPAIVKQFAAIANHLRYMFVYPLLETNKRIRLSSYRTYGGSTNGDNAVAKRDGALNAKVGEAHHQLDTFFPFDPYRLPRSSRWLEGDYIQWRNIEGMKYFDDEEEEQEENDDENDDEDDEESDSSNDDDSDNDDEDEEMTYEDNDMDEDVDT